jgi:hypothetical protein
VSQLSKQGWRDEMDGFRPNLRDVAAKFGGGAWTRTTDLRIMSPVSPIEGKEDKALSAAESGKVLQNPQPPRNNKPVVALAEPSMDRATSVAKGDGAPPLPLTGSEPHKQ